MPKRDSLAGSPTQVGATSLSATRRTVHRRRPAGACEQAKAVRLMSRAISSPSLAAFLSLNPTQMMELTTARRMVDTADKVTSFPLKRRSSGKNWALGRKFPVSVFAPSGSTL